MLRERSKISLRDLLLILGGMVIAGYGSRMAFNSGVGVAPVYMVDEGLCKLLHVDLGTAILIVSLCVFTVGFFLEKSSIGWTTVITTLFLGLVVDLVSGFLPPLPQAYWARFLYLLLGLALNTLGAAIYLYPGSGGSCMEIIMLCVTKRTGISMGVARILADALWFALGFVMGGTWGWGTLASLLICGPMLQAWTKGLNRLFHRMSDRKNIEQE